MTRFVYLFEENKDYKATVEVVDTHSFCFLHLDIFNWNKQVLNSLREKLDKLLETAYLQDMEYVFIYTDKPKVFKLAEMVKPLLEEEVEFNGFKLKGWSTGE